MNRNIEDFKQLLTNLGCDKRILKNPSFSNFPILRDAIVCFVNDKNIEVEIKGNQIEINRFLENDSFVIIKNAANFVVSYRNENNPVLNYYSEIMLDKNENVRVIEHHDSDSELVHDFTPSGLEVELIRRSKIKQGLLINGIRRCPNGYVGQIWSDKLNENKTAIVDNVIGYVDLDLRTPSLRFGAGYTPDAYDEVYRALAMNRVSYVSPEFALNVTDYSCGISWNEETKNELIGRIANSDYNNILINEKFN